MSRQEIKGIHFSDDDRQFLGELADFLNDCSAILILFALFDAAKKASSVGIKNGKDLAEFLVEFTVDVTTKGWDDAVGPFMKLSTGLAARQVQFYKEGSYRSEVTQKKLGPPAATAKRFFGELEKYLTEIMSHARRQRSKGNVGVRRA